MTEKMVSKKDSAARRCSENLDAMTAALEKWKEARGEQG